MSSPVPADLQNRIATWRAKSIANTLSIDEMREAIAALRAGRRSATEAAATSRTRSSKSGPSRSADDMLKDLEGL